MKTISIRYSRGRNSRERERERRLREELARETERADNDGGHGLEQYIQIKDELQEIEHTNCMGAMVRSRARYMIEGEKCTGFFLGLEKTKQTKKI